MRSNFKSIENHLEEGTAKWFAVYTAYKREKIVAKMLQKKGIEVFLPLQKIHKQYQRTRRIVELPLINCFVFVKIMKPNYVPVLETEHVIRFVKIGQNLISIPNHEIELIKRIIGSQVSVEAGIRSLQSGDEIEVIAGALSGLKGKFLKQESKYNFLVELEVMGYEMRLQLKPEHLLKKQRILSHQMAEI